MTEQAMKIVVLKDSDGNYYALPERGLMQARVPDEQRAEIEALIGQGGAVSELATGQLESVVGGASVAGGLSSVGSFDATSEVAIPPNYSHWDTGGV